MKKKPTIIVVSCPDQGAGNDSEAVGITLHQGPTFVNEYYQAPTNLVDRELEDYRSKLLTTNVSY